MYSPYLCYPCCQADWYPYTHRVCTNVNVPVKNSPQELLKYSCQCFGLSQWAKDRASRSEGISPSPVIRQWSSKYSTLESWQALGAVPLTGCSPGELKKISFRTAVNEVSRSFALANNIFSILRSASTGVSKGIVSNTMENCFSKLQQ